MERSSNQFTVPIRKTVEGEHRGNRTKAARVSDIVHSLVDHSHLYPHPYLSDHFQAATPAPVVIEGTPLKQQAFSDAMWRCADL